jgi:hypothetical protein
MPDALEPTRQNVEHEAAEELHGVERHHAEAVAPLIVFPTEGDLAVPPIGYASSSSITVYPCPKAPSPMGCKKSRCCLSR